MTDVQDYEEDGKLGDITQDKIFLLSDFQVNTYFNDASAEYTEYAKSKTDYVGNSWWLIDSYSSSLYKKCISKKGIVENTPRVNEKEGVRPAMWISSN